MTARTIEERGVIKMSQEGPQGSNVTRQDAVIYQPAEGYYVLPLRVITDDDEELSQELDAWDAASDEALDLTEDSVEE